MSMNAYWGPSEFARVWFMLVKQRQRVSYYLSSMNGETKWWSIIDSEKHMESTMVLQNCAKTEDFSKNAQTIVMIWCLLVCGEKRLIQISDDDRLEVEGQELDSLFPEEFELCNGKAHSNTAFKYDELRQLKYARYALEAWVTDEEELETSEFDDAKKLVKKFLKNYGDVRFVPLTQKSFHATTTNDLDTCNANFDAMVNEFDCLTTSIKEVNSWMDNAVASNVPSTKDFDEANSLTSKIMTSVGQEVYSTLDDVKRDKMDDPDETEKRDENEGEEQEVLEHVVIDQRHSTTANEAHRVVGLQQGPPELAWSARSECTLRASRFNTQAAATPTLDMPTSLGPAHRA